MGLSFREKLGASVKKGGLSHNEVHHPSRAYERYFEGYRESAEPVPARRRAKAVRTYLDDYYLQELPGKKRLGLRALYVVCYLLALPPFLYSATRLIPANMLWYVTAPQAVSVFLLGWTGLNLYRYCVLPGKMTVRQHRLGVVHFRRGTLAAAAALAAAALAYLLCAIVGMDGGAQTVTCALLCLLSCALLLAVFLTERTVRYSVLKNPLAGEED